MRRTTRVRGRPPLFNRLLAIEQAADAMVLDIGAGPFTDDGTDALLAHAEVALAVGDLRSGSPASAWSRA